MCHETTADGAAPCLGSQNTFWVTWRLNNFVSTVISLAVASIAVPLYVYHRDRRRYRSIRATIAEAFAIHLHQSSEFFNFLAHFRNDLAAALRDGEKFHTTSREIAEAQESLRMRLNVFGAHIDPNTLSELQEMYRCAMALYAHWIDIVNLQKQPGVTIRSKAGLIGRQRDLQNAISAYMLKIGARDTKVMLRIKDMISQNINDQVKLSANSDQLVFHNEANGHAATLPGISFHIAD